MFWAQCERTQARWKLLFCWALSALSVSRRAYSVQKCLDYCIWSTSSGGFWAHALPSVSVFHFSLHFTFLLQHQAAHGNAPIPYSLRERYEPTFVEKPGPLWNWEQRELWALWYRCLEDSWLEEAGSVKKDMLIKKALPKFVLCFVETSPELASRKARKNFKNIIQLASHSNSGAAEFHWHIRIIYDCNESEF